MRDDSASSDYDDVEAAYLTWRRVQPTASSAYDERVFSAAHALWRRLDPAAASMFAEAAYDRGSFLAVLKSWKRVVEPAVGAMLRREQGLTARKAESVAKEFVIAMATSRLSILKVGIVGSGVSYDIRKTG